MPGVSDSAEGVHTEVEKILSSHGFARNERMARFLRFVVEQQLAGKGRDLKETVIGVEVFGRKADYDPKLDSIVRKEAARLRARLADYYAEEGVADSIIIDLPKGGYAPVIRAKDEPAEQWPRPWRKAAIAAGVVVLLAVGSLWLTQRRPEPPVKPEPPVVAVLPFKNLSAEPESEYFVDGLTDEIIRNLSLIEGLEVRSRTSSFTFKDKPRNIREVGEQLKANLVLEGSVLRAGGKLRINTQFVRVSDDVPLWSGRFDRELKDVFAIQDEISRGIVNHLRLKLGRGRWRYETSVEAYDLYLRARALPIQRGIGGYGLSISPLEEAIARDPSFAPAYACLAAAHAARSGYTFRLDRADELARMRAAAEKAIQLDPLLAEAHEALGIALSRDAQWEQSEKSFRRAIELDPSGSQAHFHFALFLLWPVGRIDEALQQLRVAEKADPLSPPIHNNQSFLLISAGRYDEAASHCEKLPADFPPKKDCLGRARFWQGRIGEAIQILATASDPGAGSDHRGYLGYAYARAGRREEAEKLAAATPLNPFTQAMIFAGLGDKDRALEALDRAATAGPLRIGWELTYPELAVLRGDPRLAVLRQKVGLP